MKNIMVLLMCILWAVPSLAQESKKEKERIENSKKNNNKK